MTVPLLTLAPPALELGAALSLGEPGESTTIGDVWGAITKAAELVKDGSRLENLAWRHWARRPVHNRHASSSSSITTASSISIRTPDLEEPSKLARSPPSFGQALNLLLEKDSFKDWVSEAKRNNVPTLSLPDTPVANVEIRLVEPTPVPSRVGSLGGSLATGTLLGARSNWQDDRDSKPRGKFFLPSSPTKDSSEEDARVEELPRPPARRKASSAAKGRQRKRQPVKFQQPPDDEDDWSDEPEEPKSVKSTEEEEAQKKREMFAKQAIFGRSSQGLLSGMLKSGGSMVDLTSAPGSSALRSCPTHGDLTALARSPAAPSLLRSKSAIAVPLQSGISVTSRSGADSFDEATDDDFLATSATRQKLDNLAKRQAVPQGPARTDERGVIVPDSPTTRRRAIIMREMSESLRRNLILEREKSSAPRVSTSPRKNVLAGGFLRPLTRVGDEVNRAKSSANLTSEAPPMVRRSTEGAGDGAEERRRRLSRRHGSTDTSYRSHGW
ncbi:hypothetical protein BD324DRAFT_615552 [Kockovaella imperatae]|uniref:Nitrogen regulatory protein areA GATA-like domain-containing protein n=1 Tax=Kockovaella imperatae TaxID=4999 RepID=A0A1Y1URX7_9TREE|nr:hypothetical protein BD324DRAFT_615552 [Kockovaella imperatae]ORX39925.1 hypothetical protein BD324DRAFT_615552 [Kockovaella imperatae]